jgi:predicted metallo-beta-lactamase superfamily hydrolase
VNISKNAAKYILEKKDEISARLEYLQTGTFYKSMDGLTLSINTTSWWDNNEEKFNVLTLLVLCQDQHVMKITQATLNKLCAVIKMFQKVEPAIVTGGNPKR